jgi:hypothetical protein
VKRRAIVTSVVLVSYCVGVEIEPLCWLPRPMGRVGRVFVIVNV